MSFESQVVYTGITKVQWGLIHSVCGFNMEKPCEVLEHVKSLNKVNVFSSLRSVKINEFIFGKHYLLLINEHYLVGQAGNQSNPNYSRI